jgi:hypothetical protein
MDTLAYSSMDLITAAKSFIGHAPELNIIFSKDLLVSLHQTLDFTLRTAPILAGKCEPWEEATASYRLPNLLQFGLNYDCKKFYRTGPWIQHYFQQSLVGKLTSNIRFHTEEGFYPCRQI